MLFKESFELELANELEYAKDGMPFKSSTLHFYEPTVLNFSILAKMRPLLTKSFYEVFIPLGQKMLAENDKPSADTEVDEDNETTVGMILDTCQDFDKYYELFKKLILTKGICLINNEETMKDGYLHKIAIDDLDKIIRQYTTAYIFPKHLLNPAN